jgi:EmrB/QacA subfamily drug resistance transporter
MQVSPAPNGDGSVGRVSYRWVAMGVCLVGTFMVVLDTTIVNLALPSLQREYHTIDGVEWVITAYLAAVGVSQMGSSWFADRFGRKRSFVVTLAVFTVGSAMCAASPTLPLLVFSRIVQGVGGGMLIPITMAMIYELFEPEERGRALGIWGVAVMAAPAIGPVLGGTVITEIGWRWLFLVNVPIGIIGVPLAIRLLRETGGGERRRLDTAGLVGAGSAIVLLLIGLAQGGTDGFGSASALIPLAASVIVSIGFVRHTLNSKSPIVDLRILTHPVFARAMIVLVILSVAQFARLVYIPLELGTTRHITAFTIGLVMLPQAIGIAIMMPIGGRLADRIGARLPAVVGIAVFAASFFALSNLSPATSLPYVAGCLFVGGLGTGLSMMPPNIMAMNSVPTPKVSQATALSQVSRQLAAAVGTAVLAAVLTILRPEGNLRAPGTVAAAVDAYDTIFMIVAVMLVIATLLAFRLPGKEGALALQAERKRERGFLRELGQLDLETESGLAAEVL